MDNFKFPHWITDKLRDKFLSLDLNYDLSNDYFYIMKEKTKEDIILDEICKERKVSKNEAFKIYLTIRGE